MLRFSYGLLNTVCTIRWNEQKAANPASQLTLPRCYTLHWKLLWRKVGQKYQAKEQYFVEDDVWNKIHIGLLNPRRFVFNAIFILAQYSLRQKIVSPKLSIVLHQNVNICKIIWAPKYYLSLFFQVIKCTLHASQTLFSLFQQITDVSYHLCMP